MDLVTKFWNFCHTLRHEGIDYSDYIEELTYLLFLKIAEERGISIPNGCNWDNLIMHDKEDLLKKYNTVLSRLSKQDNILGDIFRHPIAKIRSSSSLKKLLSLIDEVNWSSYNEDVLGSMFEGLLERAAIESKKGAGQYFTPRPLIESIVRVMKPNPFEWPNFKISDIACGTAGFLVSSFEWWKSNNSINRLTASEKKKIRDKTYFGQELVLRPRRMAQMNLYLHGITPNIVLGDTIYEPLTEERYSCILTNPPFGTKGANQIPDRKDFKIKTSNKQLNFIQHVFSVLQNYGRAAIILPDNVLFDEKAAEVWKHLMSSCNVHTILKLPRGSFLPYTDVKANVVFLHNGMATKNVWIYDARNNITTITKKGRPLSAEHFKLFEASYGNDPNGLSNRKDQGEKGRFRKFSLNFIKNRNYNLDINWLKEETTDDIQNIQNPLKIANDAISEMKLILADLMEIVTLLDENDDE